MLFAGFNVADGRVLAVHGHVRRRRGQRRRLLDRLRDRLLRPRRPDREARPQGLHQAAPPASGPTTGSRSYGDATVFFSRMLPIIRTFISLPAGVAKMPFWRFTVLTTLGCIPWVFMLVVHRQAGRRPLGELEGQPALHRLRGDRGDRRSARSGCSCATGGGAAARRARRGCLLRLSAPGRRARADPGRGRVAAGLLVRARRGGAAAAAAGRSRSGTPARRKELEVALHAGRAARARAVAVAAAAGRAHARAVARAAGGRRLPLRAADRGAARRAGRARARAAGARRGRAGAGATRPTRGGCAERAHAAVGASSTPRRRRWRSGSRRPRRSVPGVSRTGATLAAARALGYSRPRPRGSRSASPGRCSRARRR